MCGFAGELVFAGGANVDLVRKMAARLAHRGPDAEGAFLSADGRCAIGFRRLAVIDPAGSRQPMTSDDGASTVAFNGEIYNFRELRHGLARDGAHFRTRGDTEVLLHLHRACGTDMLSRLTGMFAFALYDVPAGRLLLARDRFGEKPLYYASLPGRLVFASELKALLEHPAVGRDIDCQAITDYVAFGYIQSPGSAWRGVAALPPGHCLQGGEDAAAPQRYWSPRVVSIPTGRDQQRDWLRERLPAIVEQRMIADVPLGALLSGGVDSAVIVALMSRAAGRAGGVRTFTAGFADAGFDERPAARAVAEHCGTDHTELLVEAPRPDEMLDEIVVRYDQPFGDSSAIPTLLICREARRHVTVALVGDGGDEVFGGYERYRAMHLAQTLSPFGYLAARTAGGIASVFAPHDERHRLRRLARFGSALTQPPALQYVTYRSLFTARDLLRLLSPEFAERVDLQRPEQAFCDLYEQSDVDEELTRAQYHDMLSYLPDDLLVKTDIASMASSLELRAPMLDHELACFGLSLPAGAKVNRRRGKLLLREAFADLLPAGVFSRPKRGFAVPLGRWLREELREPMKATLLDSSFLRRKIIREDAIHGLINDHLSGTDDHRHRLWALLVLAKWLDRWA